MAYHKFINALLRDETITVTGDGKQMRGNTYVYDCVAALVAAMKAPPFEIYNIGGGEMANVWDIIQKLEAIAHRKAIIKQAATRHGDQLYTMADTSRFNLHTGWLPQTSLDEGLSQQFLWQLRHLEANQVAVRQAA
jgi:nucleoside-diphosphate-sugar epimerase